MTSVQIESFIILAKHLNFSLAARELGVSQATISLHISALEKNLGMRLFIRNRRSVKLSPQGEYLRPFFEEAYTTLSSAITAAHKLARNYSSIRIGYLAGMKPPARLIDIFGLFEESHPEISVEYIVLSIQRLEQSLHSGTIDIAVTSDRLFTLTDEYECETVCDSPLSVIYSTEASTGIAINSIDPLNSCNFVILSPDINPKESVLLTHLMKKHRFAPLSINECGSVEDQLLYVSLGKGVCISDHISRVYGLEGYGFYDLPGETTACVAIRAKENDNPYVSTVLSMLGSDSQY